ncbi:peptidoglycan-binding protein [Aureimonas glaciei]|uniref:Peptidoglycan-binding protein n=1 Tax=Aureimonas glaciei TaxID=1776957 RepID=A0A916XTY0_9HYPH|nr:peptidoglycan-binding protein [Aureimonas glaciei]GGD09228.1 peptidoglycan-binding protein [Aureimonas glaciei]
MAKSYPAVPSGENESASLAALNRSLELLEARLAKMTPAAATTAPRQNAPASTAFAAAAHAAASPRGAPGAERRRPSLADAVSEIVMRRQMLDDQPQPQRAPAPMPRSREESKRPAEEDRAMGRRFETLVGEVDTLRAEGSSYALMAEVSNELRNLRRQIEDERSGHDGSRFEAVHRAFDDLRQMITAGSPGEAIAARMGEISVALARLTDEGADRATLNTLRADLEDLRGQLAPAAPLAADRPTRAAGRDAGPDVEADHEHRGDLRHELERLRESLGSLASEDQVRAVEKRWEEFETRYHGPSAGADGAALSQLLRDELETMREKLEAMHSTPSPAVEKRWGALEERLDSRQIESSVQRLAERIGRIESSLADLPASLGIGQLEERIKILATSVESLARRGGDADLEHFLSLEERLDEISRAIVATTLQAPTIDMAPIERIEARIATLTARVDRFAADDNSQALTKRIAELSQRVEDLASNALTDQLSERIAGLADRLELVSAEWERPQVDTAAIEARLAALALRLEAAEQPRVDTEMMRSLESQISRLSEHLATAGTLSSEDFDSDFDRRLAAVEQRLDENREALIAAAREAADETARRMQAAGDQRQSEHVAQLSDNLRSLEHLSRETGDRSNQVFDAVHLTLRKIVDRLEMIETELTKGGRGDTRPTTDAVAPAVEPVSLGEPASPRGLRAVIARHMTGRGAAEPVATLGDQTVLERRTPKVETGTRERLDAPALDTAPMLDSSEANRPLEPGSGAPDIGALLERVRLQQRNKMEGGSETTGEAETRAAARRAAKAAVAEAETLRSPQVAGKSGREGLSSLLQRRRKTILMAVTAVLVALAAMPIGKALLTNPETADTRQIAAVDEAETPPAVSAPAPVSSATAPSAPVPQAAAESSGTPDGVPSTGQQALFDRSPGQDSPGPTMLAVKAPDVAAPGPASLAPATTKADDAAAVLARATAKLPASAAGGIPAAPADIGTPALVAAAAAAEPKALFEVGLRLLEGRGSQPNAAAALDWFAQSAKRGFAPAQYSLGTLYEKGNGVARDTGAARDWYLLAAGQGNIRAMHNLAVLYATGIEGKSEPETAASWFEQAADHGMRDSQYNLGILYARGSGVEQNLAQSYKWFGIVAQSGDKDAETKQKEIGEQMTPEQRTATDATIAQWTAKDVASSANTVEVPPEWSSPGSDQTASVDMTRAVRNIQAILGKLGYDAGTPDGVVGDKTTAAIAAFQKQAGLASNGKIDETLIRALLARRNG